uniref:Uncharacterized protein n=1 Tax=Anguilla anguilla TaxID=7936 RepID=A0A0E9WNY5_ANGAN
MHSDRTKAVWNMEKQRKQLQSNFLIKANIKIKDSQLSPIQSSVYLLARKYLKYRCLCTLTFKKFYLCYNLTVVSITSLRRIKGVNNLFQISWMSTHRGQWEMFNIWTQVK